jgi:hypothetical protein
VLNPMWSDAGFVADLLRARPSRTSIRESDAGREIEPACAGPCGHSLSARIPRHRHGLRFWCWSRRTGAAALRVAGDAVTRPAAGVDRPALHRRGALARAVVMAGAMERALDTAVTYAGERKQFGRPIGKFQAVQQNLAMNIVDRPGYLQLDEDDVFDEQVNSIFPDHDPIVSNNHGMLLRDGEPRLAQLVRQ